LRRVVNTVNTQLVDGNTQTYLRFGIATAQGPSRFFSNVLVRQAFGFAIDRQRIITEILGGNAAFADSLAPPSHPAHVTAWRSDSTPRAPASC
jgi:ABC-type transport system substrate-binding protein